MSLEKTSPQAGFSSDSRMKLIFKNEEEVKKIHKNIHVFSFEKRDSEDMHLLFTFLCFLKFLL